MVYFKDKLIIWQETEEEERTELYEIIFPPVHIGTDSEEEGQSIPGKLG